MDDESSICFAPLAAQATSGSSSAAIFYEQQLHRGLRFAQERLPELPLSTKKYLVLHQRRVVRGTVAASLFFYL